jgi:hypothetical protein
MQRHARQPPIDRRNANARVSGADSCQELFSARIFSRNIFPVVSSSKSELPTGDATWSATDFNGRIVAMVLASSTSARHVRIAAAIVAAAINRGVLRDAARKVVVRRNHRDATRRSRARINGTAPAIPRHCRRAIDDAVVGRAPS